MKLTVMMAAHNASAHITPALQSVLNQEGICSLDLVVVDDGSTDDTAALVSRIAESNPQIRLIRTKNQGVARARNEGLKALQSDAELVSFLDADDLLPTGRYARDIALLKADPRLDLTFGSTMMFRQANEAETGPLVGSQTASGRSIQLATGTYRASSLRAVGMFDVGFQQAEDMDFLLRLFETAPRYLVQQQICLYYRRHASNMTRDTAQLRLGFSRALFLSIRRRRLGNLPPYPADLFDAKGFAEAHGW